MDAKPFFEFDMLNFEEHQLEEVKKFTKSAFHLKDLLSSASTLKYTRAIKHIFAREIVTPSDELIRFFALQVYSGKITQSVHDQFSSIVKNALNQYLREQTHDRLKSAPASETEEPSQTEQEEPNVATDEEDRGILITQEEIEGYNIVKTILRKTVDVRRVFMHETKSYCGILFDDNHRKPICRLHFNAPEKKYISLFSQKVESQEPITEVNDIFKHAEHIKATVQEYLKAPSKPLVLAFNCPPVRERSILERSKNSRETL
jgi:hypothetical protein